MCREKIRKERLEAADSFHLSLADEERMGQAELRIAAQKHESKWEMFEA